jgi:protein-tyrosine-phosphatase
MNLLFVCTGNTCRSPMAEALARREFERRVLGWQAESAGLMAAAGDPASRHAADEMARRGLSLGAHRAREVTAEAVARAGWILAMTDTHRDLLRAAYPDARDKILTLGECAGTGEPVPDPFGGGPATYRHCADRLETLVRAAVEALAEKKTAQPGGASIGSGSSGCASVGAADGVSVGGASGVSDGGCDSGGCVGGAGVGSGDGVGV